MDLPISADSDLQRLRDMLQRVGGRNSEVKTENSSSENLTTSQRIPTMEKLGLDDVGLLDLSENGLEDEDSWLYESPRRQPTPAQKSVSPYKYLHQNIDISDLNKVRGSLMAKLESIAAQEEYLSKPSPPVASYGTPTSYRGNTNDRDDNDELEIQGPVKRRGGTFTKPMQQNGSYMYPHGSSRVAWQNDDIRGQPRSRGYHGEQNDDLDDDVNFVVQRRGEIRPRGAGIRPRGQSNDAEDMGEFDSDLVVRPRGGVKPRQSQYSGDLDIDDESMNSDLIVRPRGGVKARGATVQPRGQQQFNTSMDDEDDDINCDFVVRPRGGVKPRGATVQPRGQQQFNTSMDDDDDDEDDDVKSGGVVRPRGGVKPRGSGVQPRGQTQYDTSVNDDVEDSGLVVKPCAGVRPRGVQPRGQIPVDTGRWDIPAASEEELDSNFVVRPRGSVMARGSGGPKPRGKPQQQTSFDDDDDDDDDEFTGPVRRRTFQMPVSQQRTEPKPESYRLAWQMGNGDEDERETNLAVPRRQAAVNLEQEDDLDLDCDSAPVVRRRGATPVNANSTLPVTRRAGTPTGRPQSPARGLTPSSSGLPTPVRSRLQAPEADVKRRSLPQAPTPRGGGQIKPRNSTYSDNALDTRVTGSASPQGQRSMSPARFGAKTDSPVMPRGSKLAAPRRIPVPRGSSPREESWKEGCF